MAAGRLARAPERVGDHVRAVLVPLREAVGDHEFVDVRVHLQNEYFSVLARA